MWQYLRWLWAAPWSAVGLAVGMVALATGGRMQRRGRVLEFHGGAAAQVLGAVPGGVCVAAMTLGHVILGRTALDLDVARMHELVHVRQYERWGPLLAPAYVLCSVVIWTRGGNAYRDNYFEREAYDAAPLRWQQ